MASGGVSLFAFLYYADGLVRLQECPGWTDGSVFTRTGTNEEEDTETRQGWRVGANGGQMECK